MLKILLTNKKGIVAIFAVISLLLMLLDAYYPPPEYSGEIWTLSSLYLGFAFFYLFEDLKE